MERAKKQIEKKIVQEVTIKIPWDDIMEMIVFKLEDEFDLSIPYENEDNVEEYKVRILSGKQENPVIPTHLLFYFKEIMKPN
jgi:hypothetical protein